MTTSSSVERLERVRAGMGAAGIDLLVVRGTDRYRNEYVPTRESQRLWLTGFTGSTGDAIVGLEGAWMVVDGRYSIQARRQCAAAAFEVVCVPLGQPIAEGVEAKLAALLRPGQVLGFEAEKVSVLERQRLAGVVEAAGARLLGCEDNLVAAARGSVESAPSKPLRAVPDQLTGEATSVKLRRLREAIVAAGAEAQLLTRLDEIAWLTNLRGDELDYNQTFRAVAWVGHDEAVLFTAADHLTAEVGKARGKAWRFAPEEGWGKALGETIRRSGVRRVLLDPDTTTVAVSEAVEAAGDGLELIPATSPVRAMKAHKNPAELRAMTASFARADAVVADAIAWLNREVNKGRRVSERDFADKVESTFAERGGLGLSFKIISAAGENGAIIHYKDASPERAVRKGELMLLDTGAYFEPGYATDLTRTFLVGGQQAKADRKQIEVYTTVLKGAIRGLKARFPVGTTGIQLDAIVRAPIWEAGYDYMHGTGHGVGVLVHEAPPTISTRSRTPLEPGMVFSIEPGIYLEGWGGVRIENLATIDEDPRVEGMLQVRPLTYSPLDRRLTDPRMLTPDEKSWLRRYRRKQV